MSGLGISADLLNFVATNWLPRRWLTRQLGRFSKIEIPWIRDLSIAIWRRCSDLDLSEARQQQFRSMHDCFIRELRDGVRPINPDPQLLVSPCDAIVGANGVIAGDTVLQAKGMPYRLSELLGEQADADYYDGGSYVTLRLMSSMYHRFHAPAAARIERVRYFPGDTWNVNPPALARVPRLYCRNERAAISCSLEDGSRLTLVPVAAILVASLRLHCADLLLHIDYAGPSQIDCASDVAKGEELGWFQHGSTIIVLVPAGYRLLSKHIQGSRVRMGEALISAKSLNP